MKPKTIVATTPLELAALRALFLSATGDWCGGFIANVMHYLYEELGLENDDDGAQLDTTKLSDLMVKWDRSLK